MSHLLRRTTSVTGLAGLLLAASVAGLTAVAHAADEPAPLEVAVSGPATGDAGGTGDFLVALRNTGTAAAGEVRLRPQLPEGVTVLAVGATDAWTCVLGPLRCTLPAGLAAGTTSEALPVELHYDGLVEGPQEIGFVVQQTGSGPARVDAGRTTVDVAGAPDWVVPEEEPAPAPAAPAPAAPSPAAPAPVAPAPAAPAAPAAAPAVVAPAPAAPPAVVVAAPAAAAPVPAPVEAAAPAPVEAPAVDVVDPGPAVLAPAPADPAPAPAVEPEAPAVLPFADEQEADDVDDVASTVPVASASDGAEGIYTALLALVFGVLLVAFLYLVGRVVAQRRVFVA